MNLEITNHDNRYFDGDLYIFGKDYKLEGNINEIYHTEKDTLDGYTMSYEILVSREIEIALLQSASGEGIEDENLLQEIEEQIEKELF
jgi:hypothetical protein